MRHIQLSPLTQTARMAEYATQDSMPGMNVIFKAVSGVAMIYAGTKLCKGALEQALKQFEAAKQPRHIE